MLILRTKVRCEINDFDAICVLLSQPPGGLSFVLLFPALFRSNTHVLCIPLMCCYELVFKIISIPFLIISVILIRLFQFNSIVFPILLTQRSILSSSIVLTSRFVLKLTSVRFSLHVTPMPRRAFMQPFKFYIFCILLNSEAFTSWTHSFHRTSSRSSITYSVILIWGRFLSMDILFRFILMNLQAVLSLDVF